MYSAARPLREVLGITGPLRLLMVTNERTEGDEPGLRAAFAELAAQRRIAEFTVLAPRETAAQRGVRAAETELLETLVQRQPNVLLVLSPNAVPISTSVVDEVRLRLGAAAILYWEGDAWGGPKQPNETMAAWAAAADVVFSVALGPQARLLHSIGATEVQAICNTYCQVSFADAVATHHDHGVPDEVVFIGNNVTRLRFWHALPGGRDRACLVSRLQREFSTAAIYGRGFAGRGTHGAVPYREQVSKIQHGTLFVNWDHFPDYPSYASDRLAIGLLAGRPHVTTRHPGAAWMPGEDRGLFLESTVDAVVKRAHELLRIPESEQQLLGRAAHDWAAYRLSDAQAALFMMGRVDPSVGLPPSDPWALLERSLR